jgi:zinc transporter ZupT
MAYQLAEALQDDASGLGIAQGLVAVALASALGYVAPAVDELDVVQDHSSAAAATAVAAAAVYCLLGVGFLGLLAALLAARCINTCLL